MKYNKRKIQGKEKKKGNNNIIKNKKIPSCW